MQLIPDGLIFGLIVLAGAGAALSLHATSARQERLSRSVLYLVCALAIIAGACALAGQVGP